MPPDFRQSVRQWVIGAFALMITSALVIGLVKTNGVASSNVQIGSSKIQIDFVGGPTQLSQDRVIEWVKACATAVRAYYGRFPVQRLKIRVNQTDWRGIDSGVTYGRENGGYITIAVGSFTTDRDFKTDWMLTHEMTHLGFPSLRRSHQWFEEGLATYVEPWARVQAGNMTAQDVWRDFVRDMPQGQPEAGDRGLNYTHSWGRTYWGGALFCLVADVEIREKTKGKKGLQDALRGILDAGGNVNANWPIGRVLAEGDEATGTSVLADLHERMAEKSEIVDLNLLWKRLGVERSGRGVRFNDAAPLAFVRRAIETGRGS